MAFVKPSRAIKPEFMDGSPVCGINNIAGIPRTPKSAANSGELSVFTL